MKKKITVILSVILVISVLCGCSAAAMTQEKRDQAIASATFSFSGVAGADYYTYYFYENMDNTYDYLYTNARCPGRPEKIIYYGKVKSIWQLERLINKYERPIYIYQCSYYYGNKEIEKEELLTKLFSTKFF